MPQWQVKALQDAQTQDHQGTARSSVPLLPTWPDERLWALPRAAAPAPHLPSGAPTQFPLQTLLGIRMIKSGQG